MSQQVASDVLLDLVSSWQGRPEGEDPRFSEGFAKLRSEVEKLAGNDFPGIREQARQMLQAQALDMRVLAYATLANGYLDGAAGLAEALQAWCWLIEEGWIKDTVSVFPARENARISAITWLQQDRLATYLSGQPCDAQAVQALTEQLKRFHGLLEQKLPEPIRLKAVERWLDNNQVVPSTAPSTVSNDRQQAMLEPAQEPMRENNAAVAPAQAQNGDVETAAPVVTPATRPASDNAAAVSLNIDSEQLEQKALRDLLAWYRKEKRFEPMVRLSRSLRWCDLVTPPAEGEQTRVPAPRTSSLAAMQAALSRGDGAEALLAAEKAFLEPGGQYCLAIQKVAADAAAMLGLSALADLIQRETVALLEQQRSLMSLQFADGTPFVDGETRNWLETLLTPASTGNGESASQWGEVAVQAGVTSNQSGLAEGLKIIDAVATRGRRERTEQDLLKAELCLSNQRSDLAVPLLEALAERLDDHGIAAWDPAFAVRVWRLLQQALRARGEGADIQHRLDQITHYISRTDVRAAAAIL